MAAVKEKTTRVATKITLRTNVLQEMLNVAMEGVYNNQFLPITEFIGLKLKDNVFSITATDLSGFIEVTTPKILGKDFGVTIKASQFDKLVKKTTSEEITLTLNDGFLGFKGNGNYKISLPTDENADPIKFPEIPTVVGTTEKIHLSSVRSIIETNKIALGVKDANANYLTGYYCGDDVMTSNDLLIAQRKLKLFKKQFVAPAKMFKLLSAMSEEVIEVTRDKDTMLFEAGNVTVYMTELEDAAKYPYLAYVDFIESDFSGNCKVNRRDFLNILERLSLFVSTEDENLINLTFTENGIFF